MIEFRISRRIHLRHVYELVSHRAQIIINVLYLHYL